MADTSEAGGDAQVTFKVKTSSESNHTITMAESATVLDLKTKLAGEDFENIPIERQRLIYSGRVMKNDDTLATYKIKPNNTIHMVKSAASNPSQPAATSAPNPQAPTNMAAGTANNPLAGLTGARYAGHQINLPGLDMFGPDGGMGPPMDDERIQRMMSDPNVQSSMNEALNNPDFINMLVESNPMLRNMPNAREIITSPMMRQMMTNPQMMSQIMRMQRGMRGGNSQFPAPGATDTTPDGAGGAGAGTGNNGNSGDASTSQNPFVPPFGLPGQAAPDFNDPSIQMMMRSMGMADNNIAEGLREMRERNSQGTSGGNQTGTGTGTGTAGAGGPGGNSNTTGQSTSPPPANPFAALFPGAGGAAGAGDASVNPFGMTPEMMQQMTQLFGGGLGGGQSAPADNRPPEERYAEQLRQLNDMGFFDFDRNVAALRRSGGNVQGAVEHLLGAAD